MPRPISATEARVHFGELLRMVAERHETVLVERDGRPQVVVLPLPEYERLLAGGGTSRWRERAREARDRLQAEIRDQKLPPAEDLIREGREERDEQLDRLR